MAELTYEVCLMFQSIIPAPLRPANPLSALK